MRFVITLPLFFALGCVSPGDVEFERRMGTLEWLDDFGPFITMADSVAAGESLEVEITSLELCGARAETVVEQSGHDAMVTPYDFVRTVGVCHDSSRTGIKHSATLWFDSPGLARVSIRGIVQPGSVVTVYEYDVVVY